jgi:hypothetical protein
MSWKFVLNIGIVFRIISMDEATELCARTGYKFFCFNGLVYFVQDGLEYSTGITVEDLY